MSRVTLLLVVVLTACAGRFGDDDGSAIDAGAWAERSPRAQACKALASAFCARVDTCAPIVSDALLGRADGCVAAMTDRCFRTMAIGGSSRGPAELVACGEAIATMDCDTFTVRYPEPCAIPPGTLPDAAACAFDEQCASSFCARNADDACGTCARAPRISEPCVARRCPTGLVCNGLGRCVRPHAVSEPCDQTQPCDRLGLCELGTCVPRRKLGERCGGFDQCDPFGATVCSQQSWCVATAVAKRGERCDRTANMLTVCEAPARCIDDRCTDGLSEGAPCNDVGACAGPFAECLRGRCVTRSIEACAQK